MKEVTDAITQLKHKQAMVKAAIQNAKWKQANLMRRVLKVRESVEGHWARRQGVWRGVWRGSVCGRESEEVYGSMIIIFIIIINPERWFVHL